MEDIIGLIVMALIMIGGAVSSANKKKKAREAAERESQRRQQQTQPEDVEQEQGRFGRWSLEDVLSELNEQRKPEPPVRDYPIEDYYDRQMAELEVDDRFAIDHSATDRVAYERFTQAAAVPKPAITGRVAIAETPAPDEPERVDVEDFMADFDLRRAVIESEILRPKFEQY